MIAGKCDRADRWLTALWLLAFSALALLASGCESISYRHVRSDTEPTAVGSRILAGYATGEPEPAALPGKPQRTLPVAPPPAVNLPGPPDRPWAVAPQPAPVRPLPLPEPGAPAPVGRHPAVPAPAASALAAGDALDVQVEGHPEFSGRWTVRADGFLEVPDGGAFGPELLPGPEFSRNAGRVAELLPDEAEKNIARALQPYLVKPPEVRVTRLAGREG
jgi:hypothetical protein